MKLKQSKLMVLLTLKILKSKEKFLEKKMHGQVSREIPEKFETGKSWYWLSRGDNDTEAPTALDV